MALLAGHAVAASAQPRPAQATAVPGGAPQAPVPPWTVTWTATLESTAAAQAAVDARGVYVPLRTGQLVALDPESGRPLWTVAARTDVPVASDGERVFVAGADALDAVASRSGERLWRTLLPAPPAVGVATSGDFVFVALTSGDLVAFDSTSGAQRWRVALGGVASVAPTLGPGSVCVGLSDGQVASLELASGAVRWRRPLSERVSALAADGDRVFAGSLDNFLYALASDDGRVEWRWRTGADVIGVPVVDANRVYFVSLDNLLRALDRHHGAQRWKAGLTARPLGGPLLVGGELIVSLVSAEVQVVGARDGRPRKPIPLGAEPLAGAIASAGATAPTATLLVVVRDGRVQCMTRSETPSSNAPQAPPLAAPRPTPR